MCGICGSLSFNLDPVDPDSLRSLFQVVYRKIQRAGGLKPYVFHEDCYLLSIDGTEYFSSQKVHCPACMQRKSKSSDEITMWPTKEEDVFRYEYDETLEIGIYTFTITAVDISIYENKATKTSTFRITEDATDPIITYFDAKPSVQLTDESVDIICIASDNIGIKKVEVTITYPGAIEKTKQMTLSSDGKYIYSHDYDTTGKYRMVDQFGYRPFDKTAGVNYRSSRLISHL